MSLIFQRPDINSFRDLAESPNYLPATVEGATADIIFLVRALTIKSILSIGFNVHCFKTQLNRGLNQER